MDVMSLCLITQKLSGISQSCNMLKLINRGILFYFIFHWWILTNIYLRKKEVTILHKLFQNTEEGTLSNLFYEAKITLIWKVDKDITRKEKYKFLSLMNLDVKIWLVFDRAISFLGIYTQKPSELYKD